MNNIEIFVDFFKGLMTSHGCHVYNFLSPSTKEEGKSFTKEEEVALSLYETHLNGGEGLGIIPINEDGYCYFAVIDVDNYDKNKQKKIIDIIDKNYLPFFVFQSKSGGLHIYCFFEHKVKAKTIRDILKKYLFVFDLPDNTEIFPKQDTLKKGASGSWINLPYWNKKVSIRQRLIQDNKCLEFNEAMQKLKKTEIKQLTEKLELFYFDAPPCVQRGILNTESIVNRNTFLFNVVVYFKQKEFEDYKEKVLGINNTFPEPLDEKEIVKTILASQDRKNYKYKCDGVENLCNREECNKRFFGMTTSLIMENLVQFKGAEPYYNLDVNGKTMVFYSEKDLRDQNKFADMCMRELYFLPPLFKKEKWYAKLNELFRNIKVVEITKEEDISFKALFYTYLQEYLLNHEYAKTKIQINNGRIFKDIAEQEFVFRKQDFLKFLKTKDFKMSLPEINRELRQIGQNRSISTRNSSFSAYSVSFSNIGFDFDIEEVIDFSKISDNDNPLIDEEDSKF